jgi:chromosome segregation ATPase
MRNAHAYKPEYDEAPVNSIEFLESNVAAMRGELTELKVDFKEHRKEFSAAVARLDNDIKTAVARLDSDIKSAVAELRAEIRAMAVKAESDLKEFAARVDEQLREMRVEHKALRDKVDKNYEQLIATDKKVTEIGSKLNAFFWIVGIAIAVATFVITVGKVAHWF